MLNRYMIFCYSKQSNCTSGVSSFKGSLSNINALCAGNFYEYRVLSEKFDTDVIEILDTKYNWLYTCDFTKLGVKVSRKDLFTAFINDIKNEKNYIRYHLSDLE